MPPSELSHGLDSSIESEEAVDSEPPDELAVLSSGLPLSPLLLLLLLEASAASLEFDDDEFCVSRSNVISASLRISFSDCCPLCPSPWLLLEEDVVCEPGLWLGEADGELLPEDEEVDGMEDDELDDEVDGIDEDDEGLDEGIDGMEDDELELELELELEGVGMEGDCLVWFD